MKPHRQEVGPEAFEEWLRGIIRRSPLVRTHSKAQILEKAIKEFGLQPYAAEMTRTRVIATLSDQQASRVWRSSGPSNPG